MKKNIVGSRIAAVRRDQKLTQEMLATRLNVTRQAVSNWESGKSLPDIETLAMLAEILGVTVESIIYGSDISCIARDENEIGLLCRRLATTVYIIGFIWGIILGVVDIGPDDVASLAFLTCTIPFWVRAFLTGTVLRGISEIIRLLSKGTAK